MSSSQRMIDVVLHQSMVMGPLFGQLGLSKGLKRTQGASGAIIPRL